MNNCPADPNCTPSSCPDCTALKGEFEFKGPASVYSYNTEKQYTVNIRLPDGTLHPVDNFGSNSGFDSKYFPLCETHVISWVSYCEPPKCAPTEPKFFTTCSNDEDFTPQLVCLEPIGGGDPIQGWAQATQTDGELIISLHDAMGNELTASNYTIIGASCPSAGETLVEINC